MFSIFKRKKDKAAQLREKIFFIILSNNQCNNEDYVIRKVEAYIDYLINS